MVDKITNYAKNNQNTVQHAAQIQKRSGSLTTPFEACYAEGFWQRVSNRMEENKPIKEKIMTNMGDPESKMFATMSYTDRQATAIISLLKEDPSALAVLPSGELGNVMLALHKLGLDKNRHIVSYDKNVIAAINMAYEPIKDAQFSSYAIPKYKQLFKEIEKDPLVKNAQKNWDNYPVSAKMDVAKRIGEIQSSIFGYKAYDLELSNQLQNANADTGKPYLDEHGKSISGQIRFNTNYVSSKKTSFSAFINTAVHENDHAFQYTAIKKFNDIFKAENEWLNKNKKDGGDMSPAEIKSFQKHSKDWAENHLDGGLKNPMNTALLYGGKLRSFANIMLASEPLNWETGTLDKKHHNTHGLFYRTTPMERHAFQVGDWAGNYFGLPYQKASVLGEMNLFQNLSDMRISDNQKNLSAYAADTTCDTIPAPQIPGVKWQ